ncbi:hypothetical protein H4582DRAFT_2061778 [Lactarius indigo]|nr:hypothetical protein H4582DRAFT_2061778 [Lactarius indigo]
MLSCEAVDQQRFLLWIEYALNARTLVREKEKKRVWPWEAEGTFTIGDPVLDFGVPKTYHIPQWCLCRNNWRSTKSNEDRIGLESESKSKIASMSYLSVGSKAGQKVMQRKNTYFHPALEKTPTTGSERALFSSGVASYRLDHFSTSVGTCSSYSPQITGVIKRSGLAPLSETTVLDRTIKSTCLAPLSETTEVPVPMISQLSRGERIVPDHTRKVKSELYLRIVMRDYTSRFTHARRRGNSRVDALSHFNKEMMRRGTGMAIIMVQSRASVKNASMRTWVAILTLKL